MPSTAVAAQVGSSIIMLKKLWDELQEVPTSIADLLEQIDCLAPILSQAEQSFRQADLPQILWDNAMADTSAMYCRKALVALSDLIDDLSAQLNSSSKRRVKIACVKILLKKDQIKRLEKKLQRAVQLLTLAQQSYLVALATLQPQMIMQKFTMLTTSLPAPPCLTTSSSSIAGIYPKAVQDIEPKDMTKRRTEAEEAGNEMIQPQRVSRERKVIREYRLRIPSWITSYTWELQCVRSYGGWKFNMKQHSVRDSESEVFKVARYGTPKELQLLFTSGLASPFDVDDSGMNLLHRAVIALNQPNIQYLLDIGIDPSDRAGNGNTAAMTLARLVRVNEMHDWVVHILTTRICHIIYNGPEDFYPIGDRKVYLDPMETKKAACYCYTSLTSMLIRRAFATVECPRHESTSLISRLRSLRRGCFIYGPFIPETVSDMLQPHWDQDFGKLCRYSTASFSLIHTFANQLGYYYSRAPKENLSPWISLVKHTIRRTEDIHFIESSTSYSDYGHHRGFDVNGLAVSTPLTVAILAIFRDFEHSSRDINKFLKLWLGMVQSAGHDLNDYGRRENELLWANPLQSLRRFVVQVVIRERPHNVWGSAYLRGYLYGPSPEDWKILWRYPERSSSAYFWKLIENPPAPIPGGWVGGEEEEEEDILKRNVFAWREECLDRLAPWCEFSANPE
ncbi:hypothetical protein F5Y16DRAFT_145306 [Xylariaceae sp. FL0255]|nr:hypothetical protein F5Y16DRAFT_145306 [Xylariaceae sp. FL0255]